MSLKGKTISSHYPICATPGAILQSTFHDIDEQAAQLVGHDQSYQQLSAGSFRGRFTTAELGNDAWLFLEETNQTLAQHCHVPPGMTSFMFLFGPDQWCRLGQDEFGSGDLAIVPGSSQIFVRCPADTIFCVITIEENRLARTVGIAAERPTSGAYRLQSPHLKSTVGALRSLVSTFLAMVATSEDQMDDAIALLHLKEALLSTLALAVSTGSRRQRIAPARVYSEARALIDADLREISVTQLCLSLDVSRRTLEDVFQRQLGVGPARFIKALRLNQIRREILSPIGKDRPVADIAANWGIWHPSHFAMDYAAMFGELPSLSRRSQSARPPTIPPSTSNPAPAMLVPTVRSRACL